MNGRKLGDVATAVGWSSDKFDRPDIFRREEQLMRKIIYGVGTSLDGYIARLEVVNQVYEPLRNSHKAMRAVA